MQLQRFSLPLRHVQRYLAHFRNKWLGQVLPVKRLTSIPSEYVRYLAEWSRYSNSPEAETLRFLDSHPCLFESTATTPFDSHYFYQDIWAYKEIRASGTSSHVDVGSRTIFVGMLTNICEVVFIDIRPLVIHLENFHSQRASILNLPFADNSISSLSCLHVAEHIGLGRYGDPLDPSGTKKAARELTRVLAPRGSLYFSVPVGKPRVCFNAHRVHSPQQILGYFHNLRLVEFSGVDDDGLFKQHMDTNDLANSSYACGLFRFMKEL